MTGQTQLIAVTGASGFVGEALVPLLQSAGYEVRTIGRGPRSDVRWDPAAGRLDPSALEGAHGVIHLAGASIATRWTEKAKREIRESRIGGTRLLADLSASMATPPRVFVNASAIGIYGSRSDEWLDEMSGHGDDLLAGVVRDWEAEVEPALVAGVRVVLVRSGIVLNPDGGALAKMLPVFRMGAGGRMGDGRQWMSWISRTDLARVFEYALRTTALKGPVNAVAPEPVTNAHFTETLGRILRRPTIVPVPAFVLRALLGEMADGTVLASQRVRAAVLEKSGFEFQHPTLSTALRFELGIP